MPGDVTVAGNAHVRSVPIRWSRLPCSKEWEYRTWGKTQPVSLPFRIINSNPSPSLIESYIWSETGTEYSSPFLSWTHMIDSQKRSRGLYNPSSSELLRQRKAAGLFIFTTTTVVTVFQGVRHWSTNSTSTTAAINQIIWPPLYHHITIFKIK